MNGRIIKGIAGFYYVSTVGSGVYECKAKGIFRKDGRKPLVGDYVEIEILSEQDKEASLTKIFSRRNELIRPAAANVDQAMVLFALKSPDPDNTLLDRFLVMMERQDIPVFICFNKKDLVPEETAAYWKDLYTSCGYEVILCSAAKQEGMGQLLEKLAGRTTVVAGPSGVGKSTITNLLQTDVVMETGEISRKLKRGRHTTRHSELIPIGGDTFLCDTPGFTSLYLPDMRAGELWKYFPEFLPHEKNCRFTGCTHTHEPDCGVRSALADGTVRRERYGNYVRFFEEIKEAEKRRY